MDDTAGTFNWGFWFGAAAALLFAVFLTRSVLRGKGGRSSRVAGSEEPALTDAQREFVTQAVRTYRDEMLSYELGLECVRRGVSESSLLTMLRERKLERVTAMPILYLNMERQVWDLTRLREAVKDALTEVLGRDVALDEHRPDEQTARECERWAAAEASRVLDSER